MKLVFTLLLITCATVLLAQSIADFENFELTEESFLNGSDGTGGFSSGNVFLPNTYTAEYDSWSGWAISNTTDVSTPGYFNQYSAIKGAGVEGSANYAVSYVIGESILKLENEAVGQPVLGVYITNSTYAYLSMLEGDAFAKRFGGVTGDDPDFFRLTIRKYLNGEISFDSLDFYLADFRFEENMNDYIINDWTYVDLSSLGEADSLSFVLSSSDVGLFGMNTPAYFCVDNVITSGEVISSIASEDLEPLDVYPNPASEFVNVYNPYNREARCIIYDTGGKVWYRGNMPRGIQTIDIQMLAGGLYVVQIASGNRQATRLLIKE